MHGVGGGGGTVGELADLGLNLRVCIAGFTQDLKRLSSLLICELLGQFFHQLLHFI